MKNIGLDFGTTYSVIAAPRDAARGDYSPVAQLLFDEDHSPFYDTLAVKVPNGHMSFSRPARDAMKLRGARSYKGFKMLLAEDDESVLNERGYGGGLSPDDVVRGYISDLLNRYIDRFSSTEEGIGSLVIGIPEIWTESRAKQNKQKCFERLYDIVSDLKMSNGKKLVNDVILVSEPTCACAYYVAKYKEQNNGTGFTGNILIVDYGGGTLDIALCRVDSQDGKPKVTVLKRSGAGANEEGIIGKAGLAFMEEIVHLALLKDGFSEEVIRAKENKNAIYTCIFELESAFKAIRSNAGNPASSREDGDLSKNFIETFESFRARQLFDDTTYFTTITFMHDGEVGGKKRTFSEEISVDYGMIARAFVTVIQPVLSEQLDRIIQYMKDNNIDYGHNSDSFKIQLVGGFCNFLLVQQVVNDKLGRRAVSSDKRYIGELPTADDRTLAIAYGAALLANEQTSYGFSSSFSLGLPVRWRDGTPDTVWSIRKDTELVINKIYLFKHLNGKNPMVIEADGITAFVYEDDYGQDRINLEEKYVNLLKMNSGREGRYIMGISQDRSRIITYHWWEITQKDKVAAKIGDLESLLNARTPVEGLGPEQHRRLTKVMKLSGSDPIILPR